MSFRECCYLTLWRRIPSSRKSIIVLLLWIILIFTQLFHPFQLHFNHKSNIRSSIKSLYGEQNTNITETNNASITDDFPYTYVINEPNYCSSRSDLYIINVVGTAPWEVKARSRIRRLWANETYRSMTGFSTIFVIGQTDDQRIMNDVVEESSTFKDIILTDIFDSYQNLTFKTLVLLHWVDKFCTNPVWVLKSDADVFVNPFVLSRYLHKVHETHGISDIPIVCKKRGPASPCRKSCPHVKWRVTWDEYPKVKYPVYCMGPGYVLPRRLMKPIYDAANKTHPFRMEDIYYTGIIPEDLKMDTKKHNIRHFFPWRPRTWQDSFVYGDLMILELDKRLGRGASSLVWTNILKNRGLVAEVDSSIAEAFPNVVFGNKSGP